MSSTAPAASPAKPREKTYPVIEVFGPTVQGEGVLAGVVTHFIRFGGCDYRCSWCDSLYAVLPDQVRANAEKLTLAELHHRVAELDGDPEWVTLSGGNPAMLELGPVVTTLRNQGFKIAVETQGSRWRDWLGNVDCLTVSPKPPSSGMADKTSTDLPAFMARAGEAIVPGQDDALKIVVFDEGDLAWAGAIFSMYPEWPAFLSVGTDPPEANEDQVTTLCKIANRYQWLCEQVSRDSLFAGVRVLPQLHVIAWGHARGV